MATNLYASVTARIIEELEAGVPPWVKPWSGGKKSGIGLLPVNAYTGRVYSGCNILLLWETAMTRGYPTMAFMTYQQAQQAQAWVKKGEKGTQVLFTRWLDDEEGGRERPMVKIYTVFSVHQLEGLHPSYLPEVEPLPEDVVNDRAFTVIKNAGPKLDHGGDRALYAPGLDTIRLPPFNAFVSRDDYFSTALHEALHSTGHPTRLSRKYGKRFGDSSYFLEELVAELGSAFLCAKLGIAPTSNHASYIGGWLKMMKAEPRAIFTAASLASQGADYLWKRSGIDEETQEAA